MKPVAASPPPPSSPGRIFATQVCSLPGQEELLPTTTAATCSYWALQRIYFVGMHSEMALADGVVASCHFKMTYAAFIGVSGWSHERERGID